MAALHVEQQEQKRHRDQHNEMKERIIAVAGVAIRRSTVPDYFPATFYRPARSLWSQQVYQPDHDAAVISGHVDQVENVAALTGPVRTFGRQAILEKSRRNR